MQGSLRTYALAWAGGDMKQLHRLEGSAAIPKGVIIAKGDDMLSDENWWYVLHSSPFGVIAWPVEVIRRGGKAMCLLRRMQSAPLWRQLCIDDLRPWSAYRLKATVAVASEGIGDCEVGCGRSLQFEIPDGEPQSIMHSCSFMGFKHPEVSVLDHSLALNDVSPKGLCTQHDKRLALVRACLRDLPEDMIQHIMEFSSVGHGEYATCLSADDVALASDIMDAAEQEEVEEEVREAEAVAKVAAQKRARASSTRPQPQPSKEQAAPPPAPSQQGGDDPAPGSDDMVLAEAALGGDLGFPDAQLAVVPFEPQPAVADEGLPWTLEEARWLLPVAVGVSLTIAADNRWELRYRRRPAPPRSHNVTWGGGHVTTCRLEAITGVGMACPHT